MIFCNTGVAVGVGVALVLLATPGVTALVDVLITVFVLLLLLMLLLLFKYAGLLVPKYGLSLPVKCSACCDELLIVSVLFPL